jgi:serine/threonine protein kinase
VLAYELLTAELPFSGGSMRVTLELIMRNDVMYPNYVSPLARDFMSRCLQSNPRARPTVDELRTHAWICQHYDVGA